MAVVAVYSVKGGVGKTTIATNLAWCSAVLSRRRTLLWDLDPAGGSGFLLGAEQPAKRNAALVLLDRQDPGKLAEPTGTPNLDILVADEILRQIDGQLLALGKRKRLLRISQSLSKDYERIVLDCPPALNELSAQVIRAADIIIVPLPPSPLASRAIETIREDIAANHKQHPPILPVISMYDGRRKVHLQARAAAGSWPVIPMASVVEQMAVRRMPLGAFASTTPAAQAFGKLWTAIERKIAQEARRQKE